MIGETDVMPLKLPSRAELTKRFRSAFERCHKVGMSTAYFAAKLHVSHATILNWKSGRRIPRVPAIQQFERVSNCKILE